MRAQVGDELTVKGRHRGDEERHGEIIQVDGPEGAPPYLVRWQDGHDSLFFPASDAEITHPRPNKDT
jgi:Domain of unknown function (DUF1918)